VVDALRDTVGGTMINDAVRPSMRYIDFQVAQVKVIIRLV